MDIISECFSEHDQTLKRKLKSAGYSSEKIKPFIQELEFSMKVLIQKPGADSLITDMLANGPARLLDSINADAIAEKLQIHSGQVIVGINAISPSITQALMKHTNGLVSTAASLAWGSTDHNS